MRIRKAGKLLGCTADYRTAPPPPMPWDSSGAISAAAGLLCELNRSSWIDNSMNLSLSNHRRETKLETVNEEQMSVFENGFECKVEEGEEIEEKVEDNKGQGRKRTEKETEASGSGAVINCKKTDGKGWYCKRPAQNPHSLCTYHLTQLRSYRACFEDHVSGDHRKKSAAAVDCGGAASNYYYYYSILGPWWGKRRGPVNDRTEWNEGCGGKSNTDYEAAAGDDNGEEEEEDDGGGENRSDITYKKMKKKKKAIKRTGRKPVKARSLKSLL